MNLARETFDTLKGYGKTISDVRWVGYYDCDRKKRISVDEFFVMAIRTNYDNDYGTPEIDTTLVVVGDDWWLERAEYDGSEWWEFKTMPKKNDYEMDVTEERHGTTLITDRPYKAGEGGFAVHLHDNVYCDRNICTNNEHNGVSCDECYIAQNHNLEDDDSPCLNCGE